MERTRHTRRRLLEGVGLAAGATLAGAAGCLGRPGGTGDTDGADDTPTSAGDGGDDRFGGHAATAGIDDQPFLGPPPGEATATIVAFEDPSCPRCRTFERSTVPKIRSELTDPGKATFVFRGFPVVYPWGEPASKALEATFARDEGAFWALAGHYFDEQSAFDGGNVLDRTAAFLDAETAVDGAGVVAAVEAGEADDAVGTDLDAGKSAGASATPTVYLFRDGEYRTKATGSVPFSTVRAALGL